LYYTGSTTKSFTAASILKLIEDSANDTTPLRLSTPLSRLIDFVTQDDYVTSHATLEDALSHRTGMPRHDFSYGGTGGSVETVVHNLRNLPLSAEIRQRWQYCNMMFVTLSHVIEKLTGEWVGSYFRKHIWGPLGMNSTFLSLADARKAVLKDSRIILSTPYFWNNDTQKYEPEEYLDDPSVSGAGATISTVMDYAKYLRAVMIKDKRMLSETSYHELRTPRSLINLPPDISPFLYEAYTLGWQTGVYRDMQVFQHGGAVNGYGAEMMYVPEKDFGLAIMSNTEDTSNLVELILTANLLDRLAGVPPANRTNYGELFKTLLQEREDKLRNAVSELYPDVSKKKILPSIPLEEYAGTYFDPGYGTLKLHLVNTSSINNPQSLIKSDQVLHIDVFNKTWQHQLEIEHVTGEHFVAWIHSPKKGQSLFFDAKAAEFRIGSNGRPTWLGVKYESLLEDKIWFKRQPL
jgi:CubicO group peptidase (beta-lactamase class C family)